MKFIPYEVNTGINNMQTDLDLLSNAIKFSAREPVFRLYGWKPYCVSLGRNQKDNFLDKNLLKELNIDVVRRLTGGRALLHADEITYSFVCPVNFLRGGENVITSYKEISQILIEAFSKLSVNLDFGGQKKACGHKDYCMLVSTGADLCFEGKKLIGSAQFRKEGYILQHGSILYDYDKNLLKKIFPENIDFESIISVKEINPEISKNDIIEVLCNTIKQ